MSSETYIRSGSTLPVGSPVEYHSRSQNAWIPARVCAASVGDDGGVWYVLDVQPSAPAERVRARSEVAAPKVPAPAAMPTAAAVPAANERQRLLVALLQLGFLDSDASAAVERCSSVEAAVEFLTAQTPACDRRIQCPLCLEEQPLDGIISLDCEHRFCSDCFGGYCESKIREGRVAEDEFVCPARLSDMKLCGRGITVDQARGAVPSEAFLRFLEFRARQWEPGDGRLVTCPTPGCCRFVATEEPRCPVCRVSVCLRCLAVAHPGPCEGEGGELEALIAAEAWQRCPACGCPTELEQGCYFMKCPSDVCRGRVSFCYLCGCRLNSEDHAFGRSLAHFPRGPYNCECVNITEAEYRRRAGEREDRPEDLQAHIRRLLEI